jgi:hypothetical protein
MSGSARLSSLFPKNRRLVAIAIGALLVTAPLAGCTHPLGTPGADAISATAAAAATDTGTGTGTAAIDTAQFATNLAAAVAVQNTTAFHTTASVVPAAGGTSWLTPSEIDRATGDFLASLTPSASVSFTAHGAALSARSVPLTSGTLVVTDVAVSVDEMTLSATTFSVQLHVSRTLSSGVVWEESVPYVCSIDASGAVTAAVVQDDLWQQTVAANKG